MVEKRNQSVSFRKDDCAVLVSTDAYVWHQKTREGPYRSTFSMTVEDAEKLRNDLDRVISRKSLVKKEPD